jgi:hypothetical protein
VKPVKMFAVVDIFGLPFQKAGFAEPVGRFFGCCVWDQG